MRYHIGLREHFNYFSCKHMIEYGNIDGLEQERRNSVANALELRLSSFWLATTLTMDGQD